MSFSIPWVQHGHLPQRKDGVRSFAKCRPRYNKSIGQVPVPCPPSHVRERFLARHHTLASKLFAERPRAPAGGVRWTAPNIGRSKSGAILCNHLSTTGNVKTRTATKRPRSLQTIPHSPIEVSIERRPDRLRGEGRSKPQALYRISSQHREASRKT